MRFVIIAVLAALALPAYAGPACDLQKNMTENLCAKAFKLVLGRPLEDKSTPVKVAENTFGFGVCLLAGKGAVEDCNNGKVVNARFSCNEFADMLQENIDFGCQTMAEKSDSFPEVKNALKPISKDHRDLLCRKVWLRAEQLVLKECGR